MLALRRLFLPLTHLLLLDAAAAAASPSSLVLSSCTHARYPSLCVQTLAPGSPSSPSDLARAATSASLNATLRASALLGRPPLPPPAPSDLAVLRDCANLLQDAAGQLARTADQLARLRPDTMPTQLGNAQTWASAAMTDQDMCLREISALAGPARDAVVSRVTEASRVTSNALYLITRLGAARGRNR